MKYFGLILLFLCAAAPAKALEPSQVVVIANKYADDSVRLARYYMEKRGIPKENLIRIDTTDKEFCTREEYEREIAAPIRQFLDKKGNADSIRCLVTISGVPLRVEPPELTRAEQRQLAALQQEQEEIRRQSSKLDSQSFEAEEARERSAALEKQIKALRKRDQGAAVDSELALVRLDAYPLAGWIMNPLLVGASNRLPVSKEDVLMVARLDGPSARIVKRMIDDSLTVEETGLGGTAYFDARAKRSAQADLKGYALYDQSLHLAADQIKDRKLLPVVVNERSELFQPGEAPGAALYCGWYSLARYVDAFQWQPGAIGYHIASSECQTLRPGASQVWCKKMLEEGAAATIGPVAEPYVQAFPVPETFFGLLTDGRYSLAEAYFLSLPFLSWQMVLVGDPLYQPFKVSE